jgi:hypothetical protein
MEGTELERGVARQRAEWKARARLAVLWQSQPEGASATAADCVAGGREPSRRFEALRRRSAPPPVAFRWTGRPGGGGPSAHGR